MANRILDTKFKYFILFFIALSPLLCNRFVHGRTNGHASTKNIKLLKHKGTVKTIKNKHGHVIDCVDIHRQPAFDHPALKNHTIQMEPSHEIQSSWVNMEARNKSNEFEVFQALLTTVKCPKGSIPIRRAHKDDFPIKDHHPMKNDSHHDPQFINGVISRHEYAVFGVKGGKYNGAYAGINVWNPKVYNRFGEMSVAQVWITSGSYENVNTIEAGWLVRPNDNAPSFFIYWTNDDYRTTGCFNHGCPGFVQTNRKFVLGGAIAPISTYNNKIQHEITIRIEKDVNFGHWWLHLQDVAIGYWPDIIFTSLNGNSADSVAFGGEVFNTKPDGTHTTTQMGSGHFSGEGFGKAGFIRVVGYMDTSGKFRNALKLPAQQHRQAVTSPGCYDLRLGNEIIYYGGPGYSSSKCP